MEPFFLNPPSKRTSEPLTPEAARRNHDGDASRLIEELQVHRVELEMQNRALREAQAELEASVRLFADLYDHVPNGYLTLSPSGQILQANLTATEWLRRDRRVLVGGFFRMFLTPFDAGRFAAHLEHCENSDGVCHFEATLRLDDGTELPLQLSSRLVKGERDGAKLHCAMTRASKLMEVQRELEETRAELHAYCDAAAEALRDGNAATLFPRLLEYSRSRRASIEVTAVPLCPLVENVVQRFAAEIRTRRAEVVIPPELPAVRASVEALSDVVATLLQHFLANPGPGEPPRIRLAAAARGPFVLITVTHDGLDVPFERQLTLFDIAARPAAPGPLKLDHVGLALARRVITRMGGRIWVDSNPGRGTCFSLELPAA